MKAAVLLFVCLLLIPGAEASTRQGLKAAYDEFHYSLTVEWDQLDKAKYQEHFQKLQEKLKELQADGLTREELIKFAKDEAENDRIARDIDQIMSAVKINRMEQEEAYRFISDSVTASYSKGASWNGRAIVVSVLVVASVVAILYIAALNALEEDLEEAFDGGNGHSCGTCENVCTGGLFNRSCEIKCVENTNQC